MERKDAPNVGQPVFPARALEPMDEFQVLSYCSNAIEQLGGTEKFDFVIASGGRISGFHHGFSDLDLYFCPVGDYDVPRHLIDVDGCVVQFNRVPREVAAQLAFGMRSFTYSIGNRTQFRLFDQHRKLISRIVTATRVWVSDDGRATLDAIRPDVYKRLAMALWGRQTGRLLEDVVGGLDVGDLAIACRAASEALMAALECGLAATGDLHSGDSLLWRRFANNAVLSPLQPEVFGLSAALCDPTDPGITRTIRSACRLASVVATTAQLDGWDGEWRELSITAGELADPAPAFAGAPGADRPLTNPFHVLLRYADGLAIDGPDRALRCDERTARVWMAANTGGASANALQMLADKGLLS